MTSYIYLHGFASSPQSTKASYIHERFRSLQLDLSLPDLNQGNFSYLTLTRQIQQIEALLPPNPTPITLIGSSLGGLTAAWLAERHEQIQQLVLLAPAWQFLHYWLTQLGEEQVQRWRTQGILLVYHYGEQQELPLSYDFVTDFESYPDGQIQRSLPTLILHGRYDEVIPLQASQAFAARRPWVKLVELESDHALGNKLDEIWREMQTFCRLRSPSPHPDPSITDWQTPDQ
jgi:hypothetical protein